MADPVTDPQTQEPAAAPPPWAEVVSDPAFRQAPPEDKLVAFGRWHDQAYDFATKQPDWEQHKDNFNQSAAEIQSDLGKAAGGLSLEQARAKVGQQAVDAARSEHAAANPVARRTDLFDTKAPTLDNPLGDLAGPAPTELGMATREKEPVPFTDAQEREALRPFGPDIWKAYYNQKAPQPTGQNQEDQSTTGQFGHEMLDIGREFQANLANKLAYGETALKNSWSQVSDQVLGTNIAVPDKAPDTQAALADYDRRILNAHETLLKMPTDNPDYERVKNEYEGLKADRSNFAGSQNKVSENFTNAVEDLTNTLGNIDPVFHVDPSLKNTLNTKLAGIAGDIGPAFLPGVGVPLMMTESAIQRWGGTYLATGGDEKAADAALAQDLGTNLLFMGLAHGANNLLLNAISQKVRIPGTEEFANLPTLGAGKSLAVRAAGGAAANAVIGQAIQGAEAAKDAPQGEKLAAFAKAFNTPDGSSLAQAIGFGLLGAQPIESIKAVARERAAARPVPPAQPAEAEATNLEQSGAPKTAQVVREEAAANPEIAAGEGLFVPPVEPQAQPEIRLVSRRAADGTYTHNLQVGPTTSVEQLQAFKANADLSHLPPEARTAVTEQIDNAIAAKEQTTKAATAPAEAVQGQRVEGPVLVDPAGNIIAEGRIGETHETIMRKRIAELEKEGAPREQIDAVMDAFANDAQHKFIDDQRNPLDRQEGARLAVEAGQAPEGTEQLQSQNLRPPGFHPVAQRAATAPAEEPTESGVVKAPFAIPPRHPLTTPAERQPTQREVAVGSLTPKTPEEKAAKIEQGRKESMDAALESGLQPLHTELHTATANKTEASKLGKEIEARLATEFPPETLAQGERETSDVNKLTGDKLPSVIGADGKVRPKFTNNPELTAQQLDAGQRVVVPPELLGPDYKVNPAITLGLDKTTGERYVLRTDVKLPDGRVETIEKPDDFTKAYKEAIQFEKQQGAQAQLRLDPETLQKVKDAVDRELGTHGIDHEPLEFDQEFEPGNVDENPEAAVRSQVADKAAAEPQITPDVVALRSLKNYTDLDRVGLAKPIEIDNPIRTALDKIATDTSMSVGERKLAKALLRSNIDWSKVKLELYANPIPGNGAAWYSTMSNDITQGLIQLNTAALHQGSIISSLLHEVVHHATMGKLAADYKRNPYEEVAYQSLKRSYVKALKLAFQEAMGRAGNEEELRAFAAAQRLGVKQTTYPKNRKYYGLVDLAEFISEALTNKNLQTLLAGAPDTRGELTGRIRKFVDQIKESLKRLVVGQHFEKGSVLDHALEASFALLRHPQEQARVRRALTAEPGDVSLATKAPEELAKMSRMDLVSEYRDKFGEPPVVGMTTDELRTALGPEKPAAKQEGTDEISDRHYGWLAPNNKFHEATLYRHADEAQRIIESNPKLQGEYQKETQTNDKYIERAIQGNDLLNAEDFLLSKGFVRVAGGPGNTTTYIQGKPTRSQLSKLKDAAIAKGVDLMHEVTGQANPRLLYSPRNAFTAPADEEPTPELTHETTAGGQTVHGLEIPPGTSAENLRGALDMIAASKIPVEEKNRLIAQVGEKLATFQVDKAADDYTKLQEQIAKQPNGEPTAAQSVQLDKIKADMPAVVDHPQVQASAQALRIVPGFLDVNDVFARHLNAGLNWLNTTDNANWWGAWYNAAENKAVIFARQRTNDIRGVLRRAMNRSNKAPTLGGILADIAKSTGRLVGRGPAEWKAKERDERALSFVVEAKNDPAALDVMRAKIKAALAQPSGRGPLWLRKANQAIDAIDHAKANWARLSIAADQYTKYNQEQVKLENLRGVATNYRSGYVPHLQDLETDPDTAVLFNGASGTGGVGFKKMRAYDTFADSIAAGITPKTLNALDAMENRINRGLSTIGRQEWAQAGRALTDPVTQTPVVTDVIIDKHPKTGDTQTRAPVGYMLKLLGNRQIAVHKQYAGLFDAFTKPSAIRENIYGNAALQTEGLIKHGLLLFDTFHLGRLGYYQGAIRGKPTFTKGKQALDYSDAELQNLERNGDLPPGIKAQDLINRKQQMQGLIDQGLNVGGIQETINAGLARKIPLVGDFNKFVFEQFQRGGMAESALSELERQRSAFPELDEVQLQRKVARDINTRFGNLKKEGWLYSDTMSDLANLVLLAPSWNEGLIRSELGLGKQVLQSAKDLTIGYKDASGDRVRTLRAGTLLKGGGTLFLGTLVMNQIINYITRGHPTWQNPEEGINSKISAWIPDKIGQGPGFFLNPFTLPAEITHQILEQTEHGLNWQQAIAKVAGYKFSPVLRSAETFRSQTDRFGRPLYSKWDVMKEMVNDLTPIPIFGQAGAAAVKSLTQGKVAEPYKGAIEKQAFATAGIKVSGAPSDATRMNRLANDYLQSVGKAKDTRYTGSDYQGLRQAIENNDPERARKEYQKLLETHKPNVIDKHFREQVHAPLTGKRELESRFRDTLSPEQTAAYERMIKQRENLRDAYFDLNLHPEENP